MACLSPCSSTPCAPVRKLQTESEPLQLIQLPYNHGSVASYPACYTYQLTMWHCRPPAGECQAQLTRGGYPQDILLVLMQPLIHLLVHCNYWTWPTWLTSRPPPPPQWRQSTTSAACACSRRPARAASAAAVACGAARHASQSGAAARVSASQTWPTRVF